MLDLLWRHHIVGKTEFNALDIVLNFDIHRFHTFWYTSIIMFHRFSLKLPIFALIFTFFCKIWKILNLNAVTPKRHICAWDHLFELHIVNIFLWLWSVHETKKIVWLRACKKKNWNFPYLPSQNGLTDFCQILHDNSTMQPDDIH